MPSLSYEQGGGIVSRLKHNKKYRLLISCESEDADALSYASDRGRIYLRPWFGTEEGDDLFALKDH
jgi:hypothetical protein